MLGMLTAEARPRRRLERDQLSVYALRLGAVVRGGDGDGVGRERGDGMELSCYVMGPA